VKKRNSKLYLKDILEAIEKINTGKFEEIMHGYILAAMASGGLQVGQIGATLGYDPQRSPEGNAKCTEPRQMLY